MASKQEKAKSKAQKKAMSQLKKEMRQRAKSIERGDAEALGDFAPRRSKNSNLEAFVLAITFTFIITIFLSNYAKTILFQFNIPIEVDLTIPFFWDYNHGFNELGLKIFAAILVSTFILLKLSQKRTRVQIRYFLSTAKIRLWGFVTWSLEKLGEFWKWIKQLLQSAKERLQLWSEKLPGILQKLTNWLIENSEKLSKWSQKVSASSRKFLMERYHRFDQSIQRSRERRLQRREATNSDLVKKYRKIRHLKADGGMAEVYLVRDKISGVELIWKQASPSRKNTLESVNKSIENEVEILQSIDHPRIPKCIDSGLALNDDDEMVQVLVMDYIDGASLNHEMRVFQNSNVLPPINRVLEILGQCCEVLEYLADLSPPIYHRDIKPHNILTSPEKGVVLIDFGLAKEIDSGGGVSLSGGAHTEGWSPPERTRAISGGFTDVYGLGQILWHMLTNEAPGIYPEEYRIEKIEALGHPEWVSKLVNKATFPSDPKMRIQSAAEFRIWLEKEVSVQ